jgi:hypothetical protein
MCRQDFGSLDPTGYARSRSITSGVIDARSGARHGRHARTDPAIHQEAFQAGSMTVSEFH